MTVDFKEYSRRMDKALEHLDEEFASVRAGRANAAKRRKSRVIVAADIPGSPPLMKYNVSIFIRAKQH